MYADRLPPHDLAAEAEVLGAVLLDGESMDKIAHLLAPSDFYRDAHAHIYEACLRLFRRAQPVTEISVAHELAADKRLEAIGGPAYLSRLVAGVATPMHVAHFAESVAEQARLRRLINICGDAVAALYDAKGTARDIISDAMPQFTKAVEGQMESPLAWQRDVVGDAFADLYNMADPEHGGILGAKTGFRDLDEYTGGFRRGSFSVWGGRPGMWKSTLINHLAHSVAERGVPVLFATMEETRRALVRKEACRRARINEELVKVGKVTDEDWERVNEQTDYLYKLPVAWLDGRFTTADLNAYISVVKAKYPNLGVVFCDHLRKFRDGAGRAKGYDRISFISESLAEIAKAQNVHVACIAQLNREVESRPPYLPQLSDLRDSGTIEEDARFVAMLWRQDYYEQTRMLTPDQVKPEFKNVMRLLILKNNDGQTGEVRLTCRPGLQEILPYTKER